MSFAWVPPSREVEMGGGPRVRRSYWFTGAFAVLLTALAGSPGLALPRPGDAPRSANYSEVVLADQPIMYWRLGELKGRTAFDSSGHLRNATYLHHPRKGKPGAIVNDPDTSVRFDGVDDFARWKPDTSYSGSFSAEAWVRSTVRGVQDQAFLSTRGRHVDYSFDIKLERSNVYGYGVRVDVGNGSTWFVTETIDFAWKRYRWYHIVGVATLADVTIYVNGSSIGTLSYGTGGTPLLFDVNHPVQMGRASPFASWFTGKIDEVAFYDYALTSDQVSAHYAAGIGP